MKKVLPLILIILMFISGFYFFSFMPSKMKVHWGVNGEADGYGGKFFGLFLLPIISLSVYLMFILIPRVAVFKNHVVKWEHYDKMIIAIVSFFFILYFLTIFANLGYNFNMTNFIMPLIGLLLFYIGFLIKDVKRNYFIGIRTPWTLASDKVWKKTHELGSYTFMINGVIVALSIFLKGLMIWIILGSILINVFVLFVYSFLLFKKKI